MAKKRTGHYANAYDIEGPEDAVELYKGWAKTYEDDVAGEYGYAGATETAGRFMAHCPDKSAHILDAGCGTGLVGQELAANGYKDLDGLDISPEMLAEAKKKGVYGKLIEADLTQRTSLGDDSYDSIVCAGTFTHGHVGTEGIDELVRVCRPGGVVCFSIHEDVYDDYGFEAAFQRLTKEGKAELIENAHLDYVPGTETKAWVATLKVR